MKEETINKPVTRYFDKDDQPTCAINFKTGQVCIYYRTVRFGCSDTCIWFENPSSTYLRRRDKGDGSLIPHADCPLFDEMEDESRD